MSDASVLIVDDDDEDLAFGIGIRLRRSGCEVLTVADAYMAQHRALRDRPDVTILDLGLPGGGMAFLQRSFPDLDATSADDRGATVLSRTETSATPRRRREDHVWKGAPMANPRVLIVDDDPDLALGIGIRLQRSGYDVVSAPDVVLAQQRLLRDRPDAVILDLGLPGGGGMTFLRRAQANLETTQIPVIVLTAKDHSVEAEVLEAGAFEFYQKPVDTQTLIGALERALGREEATV
ncbi:MAG: response regulator [Actinobacteria bacterium]|nr:response regulator [Actinomycetota bacterium]